MATRKKKRALKSDTKATAFNFEVGRGVVELVPGGTYTVAIEVQPGTDDSVGLTWNDVAVTEYAGSFTWELLPAFNLNLGNRLARDAGSKYYVYLGSFVASATNALLLGTGIIGIGSGSGTDRLKAQGVIKEGVASSGTTAGSLLTIYEGPVSAEATRNNDAEFFFASSPTAFGITTPGKTYSVFIVLYVNCDDTVFVSSALPYLIIA